MVGRQIASEGSQRHGILECGALTGGSVKSKRMAGALAHADRAGATARVSVGYRLQVGDIVWGKEDIRHME